MNTKLKIFIFIVLTIILILSVPNNHMAIQKKDGMITSAAVNRIKGAPTDYDIIPDRFNTGCDNPEKLEAITSPGVYDGIKYKQSGGNKLALDFNYTNKSTENDIVIRNYDFSASPFVLQNDVNLEEEKNIIFSNCKFAGVVASRGDSLIQYSFQKCTLESFTGSNCSFDECRFGGSANDALNPLSNVTLTNCFIADLSHEHKSYTLHSDGTQIFGYKNIDAKNITYRNCRFEIPTTKIKNNKSYVNSCLAVALEFSNGKDITFRDCLINGGGYSIYATAKAPFTLENILFENIQIGGAHRWGDIYPKNNKGGVELKNITDISSLYVASVWRDKENKIHLSVTNDTNQKRTLAAVTSKGIEYFKIPSCPTYKEQKDNMSYEEFPFDIEITLKQASDYVICYDSTTKKPIQIRFVNWSKRAITFDITKLKR